MANSFHNHIFNYHLATILKRSYDSVLFFPDKALKESLDHVLLSGYFDQAPAHQNGVCEEREPTPAQQQQQQQQEEEGEEEEMEEVVVVVVPAVAAAAVEPSVVQEQTAEPGHLSFLRNMSQLCLF